MTVLSVAGHGCLHATACAAGASTVIPPMIPADTANVTMLARIRGRSLLIAGSFWGTTTLNSECTASETLGGGESVEARSPLPGVQVVGGSVHRRRALPRRIELFPSLGPVLLLHARIQESDVHRRLAEGRTGGAIAQRN